MSLLSPLWPDVLVIKLIVERPLVLPIAVVEQLDVHSFEDIRWVVVEVARLLVSTEKQLMATKQTMKVRQLEPGHRKLKTQVHG